MSQFKRFSVSPKQLGGAILTMNYFRAVSVPLLTDEFRLALLKEAESYPLRPVRESVGNGNNLVKQKMNLQSELNPDGLFFELVREFQSLFEQATHSSNLFDGRVVFNDLMLQRYDVGAFGITPHRDRTDYRYMICLFVLAGHGRFYTSKDRQKTQQQEIANLPGDVILTPAPGFRGLQERPFHYLEDISEERWVFGLRHDETKLN